MEEKLYYIEIGNYRQIPVLCNENQLHLVATAIGKGANASFCAAYDKPNQNPHYNKPYVIFWDCM